MDLQFATSIIIVAWVGWAILAILLGVALYITNLIGRHLFRRIRRVYHISVMWYWLDRLDREGKRTFQKAGE